MIGSQYLMFCSDFGKWRELPIESLFCKNESEGANESLPFFVWCKCSLPYACSEI